MQMNIDDKKCFVCNSTFSGEKVRTAHHMIPKHMFPKNNIIVPVCEQCHKRINKWDKKGIAELGYKIKRQFSEVSRLIEEWDERTKK